LVELITFTPEEKAVVRNIEFFRLKASVTRKVLALLTDLHRQLKNEVENVSFIAPIEVNLKSSQFVKGEHYRGLPYIYLDFPKYFTKVDKFTFRWMLWWGHYFIFALISEGLHADVHRENLIRTYDNLIDKDFYIATHKNLWEWVRDVEHAISLNQENKSQVIQMLKEKRFLKLQRFVDLDDDVLNGKRLVEEAIWTFNQMKPLVTI
jgi:hypothetical protein